MDVEPAIRPRKDLDRYDPEIARQLKHEGSYSSFLDGALSYPGPEPPLSPRLVWGSPN